LVDNLTKDIASINQTESEAEKSILQHREKFSKNINTLIQKEFADVQNEINKSIFSGNKLSADLKKQDKALQKQLERKGRSFFSSMFSSLEKMSRKFEDYKYDPKNPVINFGDHKENLRERFKDEKYQEELNKFKSDKDLNVTIERIQNGIQIANQALGEKEIFDFLVSVNDLVRIAPKFGEKFPFDQYQEIDQLPVIEVEFTHLKEVEESSGKLILLDTPGPNEAGQAHLRPMLQDQLKKASAVLAVMDYTQLKSEADAQVRDDLKAIGNTVKNRIYALVNKFDNKDRNAMKEDEVKEFITGLTDGLIKKEKVYPVSAKRGYLANQAKNELKDDGWLPDIKDAAWVEDFYKEVGLLRESRRTPERIAEGIEDLWEDSKFSQPLNEVIEESYKKAAFFALDSAIDKLDECSEKINTILAVKETSVQKTASELQELVDNLTKDIASII
jgi:GTPase SAR1 family protein